MEDQINDPAQYDDASKPYGVRERFVIEQDLVDGSWTGYSAAGQIAGEVMGWPLVQTIAALQRGVMDTLRTNAGQD